MFDYSGNHEIPEEMCALRYLGFECSCMIHGVAVHSAAKVTITEIVQGLLCKF